MSDSDAAAAKKKSKKPANTAFKQQRLPAWQPVMTAKTVIPTFFILGAVCIPLGAVLYTTSDSVKEKVIDYTDTGCKDCYDNLNTTGAHNDSYIKCKCNITFTLDSLYEGPVFMYYGLENFYQNHRRYVRSRDDVQLQGEMMSLDGFRSLSKDCDPYRSEGDMMVAPCGAIANSLFNDTLTLMYNGDHVPLIKKGIAWPTDRSAKFKNPTYSGGDLCSADAFANTIKPPNWPKRVCELDTSDPDNNGYMNEDLIVWMRTAALPNFRKLYRKINHTGVFADGLPAGVYFLLVDYNYPVKAFDGRKKMILSTVSWIGGKNPFLGLAYIVVGVVCFILAVVFLVIHCRLGKSVEEMIDVTQRTSFS